MREGGGRQRGCYTCFFVFGSLSLEALPRLLPMTPLLLLSLLSPIVVVPTLRRYAAFLDPTLLEPGYYRYGYGCPCAHKSSHIHSV